MMTLRTVKQINAHAEREFPKESCGLVIVEKGKEVYVPCRNIAEDPMEHFVLAPEDYANAEDRGEPIGVVHSHPNYTNRPSPADLVACEASGLPWHIVHVSIPDGSSQPVAGEIHSFEPTGYTLDLIGRPFSHGVLDCYTLIQDFYARELGIELPHFDRSFGWWDRGEDLYFDNIQAQGFTRIEEKDIQYGDLIMMQVRSPVMNHSGVYIGDGQMMHHMAGRLSTREIYGGYWGEVTRGIYRHKDLS